MPYYIIHNNDGIILRSVVCSDDEIDLNTESGETALEWDPPIEINNYWISGGVPTEFISPNPEPGSTRYYWDTILLEWVDSYTNQQKNSTNVFEANSMRAGRLAATDWTQLADAPDYIKDSYAPYRAALREIELQADYPDTIIWPTPPEFELYRVPDAGGINEGSSVTVFLSTTQIVDNTLVPFTIHGANITVGDISTLRMNGDVIPTALTGNLEVIGGQATLQVTFANDLSTEGVEEMIVYLPGTLPMVLVRVNINDTSYA
jgi:hypothetical protein